MKHPPDPAAPFPVADAPSPAAGPARFLGIDLGAETLKVVELIETPAGWRCNRRARVEHEKAPERALRELLAAFDWSTVAGAAACGRLSRLVTLPRVPAKQAQARAYRFLYGPGPATLISVGSHGFSVLELRANDVEVYRENSRCSQGTGNFLRQLTERFGLGVEEASALCADVPNPAPLSGRCPVILKTDMTHLANKGEDRARVLAGLFDAVCNNVLTLVKPRISPSPVLLLGGVSLSARVRRNVARFLGENGLTPRDISPEDALFFEALGSALVAAEHPALVPAFEALLAPQDTLTLERLAPLGASLPRVRRMPPPPPALDIGVDTASPLVLGLDIGSTGSKAVALDPASGRVIWEGYRRTAGDPVGAAQALVRAFAEGPAACHPVLTIGATGSGREIVGSLLMCCYGCGAVFVMNEIVAHAEGALHYDRRVDTIFEIGGQDAKYIRLADGRVIDCAMNEACSAGTGSFIEEQGRKFAGLDDVAQLGREALNASHGVSLGQHCSVFMAEVIDEAVAAGIGQAPIIAGLYDSIIQNYLNRVKGSRSVGQIIFCQGMPFSADALAAAVARQTGSEVVVPPNPGTVGALGIALLAHRTLGTDGRPPLDLAGFLAARVDRKDTFVCKATVGCGAPGNRCRIDSLKTVVGDERRVFNWGGACSLYDKGTAKIKLPDLTPDPFREREALVAAVLAESAPAPGNGSARRRVALTDEFTLKGLLPFFATFLRALGFELHFVTGADHAMLKRGIQEANVPFCAPMQLYQGLVSRLAAEPCDFLFLPMIRHLPRVGDEPLSKTCPIVQASPDMLRPSLSLERGARVVSPVIDFGPGNLDSDAFRTSCRRAAEELGVRGTAWETAWRLARDRQRTFDRTCLELGQRALDFCAAHDVVPVVVLGRPYTIYNQVLNSNVPALLREQGALAIPIDCYPVAGEVSTFHDMYWAHGQRILRAAHHVRRTPGTYALYASNYSCGPDSFNLHFCTYMMEGKPFAIIETDGHSGDAGTKTRVEAFLHCVREDRRHPGHQAAPNDFGAFAHQRTSWAAARDRGERLLIARMGSAAEAVAAAFRGLGVRSECLPVPDNEALRLGRRQTSGKECFPMTITLGSILQRVQNSQDPAERFAVLMPRALGPCRFGMYTLLNQIVYQRLGLHNRVRVWSPDESDYFAGLPAGFSMLLFAGLAVSGLLEQARLDTRPVENREGLADQIYDRHNAAFLAFLEQRVHGDLAAASSLWQVAGGELFGLRRLLAEAAAEFAAARTNRVLPTVVMVGEIYVRLDPFSNSNLARQLEARGLRVRLAPATEWMEYVEEMNTQNASAFALAPRLKRWIQQRIQDAAYSTVAAALDWPKRTTVRQALDAATPYIRPALTGEAVLTLGGPVREWQDGHIDAVVSVGPLECMPNKVAEAQFFHAAERESLLSLTLSVNGDPIAPEVLDNFAFEVHERFRRRQSHPPATPNPPPAPCPVCAAPEPCDAVCGTAATTPSRS